MTFEEYLRANGATDEDLKVLNHPAARKAFDALQTAESERARIETNAKAYEERVNTWYEEQNAKVAKTEQDLVVTRANEARARQALMTAQERGLLNVAKDLGYEPDPPKIPVNATGGFNPDQYFTRDQIVEIARKEGDAIAIAQDIAAEHRILFPDKPLKFRELRAEAESKKMSVEQLWMDRFGVTAARDARAKSEREADIAKWKTEGAKEKEAELVSRFGNPDTRPLVPSSSPLTHRPVGGREKQPWELGGGDAGSTLQQDRVQRATQKLFEKSASGTTN